MALQIANLSDFLKIRFGNTYADATLGKEDAPLLQKARKVKVTGRGVERAVQYGRSPHSTRSYSKSKTNAKSVGNTAFYYPTKDFAEYYTVTPIERKLIAAAQGDMSLFPLVRSQVNNDFVSTLLDVAAGVYGDRSSKKGTVGATTDTGTTTLVLSSAADVVSFEEGELLVFAADTSSALRSATAVTVTKVDRIAGSLTLSATLDSVSAQTGDAIFREGSYTAAGDTLSIAGLSTHVPKVAETSGTLFGVDRTVDIARLQGGRYTFDQSNIYDSILEGCHEHRKVTGLKNSRGNEIFMNPEDHTDLQKDFDAKAQTSWGGQGEMGNTGQAINTVFGRLPVNADVFCPKGTIWCVNPKNVMIQHIETEWIGLRADSNGSVIAETDSATSTVATVAYLEMHLENHAGTFRLDVA